METTRFKNIFWGVILLVLGVVLALKNFGVIYFSWRALLQLWPILLILWGVSVLPLRASIKVILALGVAALAVAIVYYKSPQFEEKWFWQWNEDDSEWTERDWTPLEQSLTEPWDSSVKVATLKIDAGAGKYIITDTTHSLIYFFKAGNLGPFNLESYDDKEGRKLHISMKKSRIDMGKVKNDVHIKLNAEPIWNLEFNAGAAEMNLDLSKFKVKNFQLSSGAVSAQLKLGALVDTAQVEIEMGAASLTIAIPKEAGCQVKTETLLTSRNLEGFDKIHSGLYQTPGFEKSARKIFIEVESAVSNLSIEKY